MRRFFNVGENFRAEIQIIIFEDSKKAINYNLIHNINKNNNEKKRFHRVLISYLVIKLVFP